MGGADQPFLYDGEKRDDARFPTAAFDPKAVTRASYVPKPKKPKHEGPLISFNRHPDTYEVLGQRSHFRPMSQTTKAWIKWMRWVQLGFRILECIGAIGILIVTILLDNIEQLPAWVMRITAGVVILCCGYAIFHLSRHAGGRTPGSSAAYHVFAGLSDLCVLPLYAYAALTIRNGGQDTWTTRLADQSLAKLYLIPGLYYGLIGAGGLHLASLATSAWLAVMFRRITTMPPDMNPLESHLTSRASHKRNKSSIAASSFYSESEKRLSTPLEDRRRSGMPYEDVSLRRPPSVPFMHTRQGSSGDGASLRTRDSRLDLPSRQYQLTPSNASSPRNSATSAELKRMSVPRPSSSSRPVSHRGSYAELPLGGATDALGISGRSSGGSRPSTGTVASHTVSPVVPQHGSPSQVQPRAAKFSETWYASDSLITRTQKRNRALQLQQKEEEETAAAANKLRARVQAYEALTQRYDTAGPGGDDYSSDDDELGDMDENAGGMYSTRLGVGSRVPPPPVAARHPNPLRSNPSSSTLGGGPGATSSSPAPRPASRPLGPLAEVNLNDRRVSGGDNIAEARLSVAAPKATRAGNGPWQQPRNRDSSIQPEADFFSKPYGELKPGTPPVMIGTGRQVSSGNDYEGLGGSGGRGVSVYGRRKASGKAAEEGRAGEQQRHSMLNR